jgi:hypothetical protein
MQIYWTNKSIPELQDLEPPQRRAAWRACCLRSFRHWQTWVAFVTQFATILAGGFIGLFIDGHTWILFGGSQPEIADMRFPAATVGLALIAGVLGSMFFAQVCSQMMRLYLKHYVEAHHVA